MLPALHARTTTSREQLSPLPSRGQSGGGLWKERTADMPSASSPWPPPPQPHLPRTAPSPRLTSGGAGVHPRRDPSGCRPDAIAADPAGRRPGGNGHRRQHGNRRSHCPESRAAARQAGCPGVITQPGNGNNGRTMTLSGAAARASGWWPGRCPRIKAGWSGSPRHAGLGGGHDGRRHQRCARAEKGGRGLLPWAPAPRSPRRPETS